MTQVEGFHNLRSFNLTAPLLAGDVTLAPPSYSGWLATGQFRLRVDNEYLLVTDASTHPWPILRAQEDGSSAVDHALGAVVYTPFTAGSITALRDIFKVGVQVFVDGGALVDGVTRRLHLDNTGGDTLTTIWNEGFDLNGGGDGFLIPLKGRYDLIATVNVARHATLWTHLLVTADGSLDAVEVDIAPTSLMAGAPQFVAQYVTQIEQDVGFDLGFQCEIVGANATISYSLWTLQYRGDAVSI